MILDVRGLAVAYSNQNVLNGVNFSVGEGEILAVLGPNGVGKTSLLKCLCGIITPSAGKVLVNGKDVCSVSAAESAKMMAYVAQKSESARLTAFDAILLGRKPRMGWRVTEADLRIVDAAIERLDLRHLAMHYIDRMSSGELQKVCIARAIVQEPTVLLLDEPTSSLDIKNQLEILRTIRTVVSLHSVGVVMTMHDVNLAMRFADRFLLLKDGAIYAQGTRGELNPEMIRDVYGVDVEIVAHNGHSIMVPK